MKKQSDHQVRVEAFMLEAGQNVPPRPTMPDEHTRLLRAKLILEETLETIAALGVDVRLEPDQDGNHSYPLLYDLLEFTINNKPDFIEIVDGCADLSVVSIGTLSALGVYDYAILREVDQSNLNKFDPGGHRRDDGKWIKPPNWKPPQLAKIILEQIMGK